MVLKNIFYDAIGTIQAIIIPDGMEVEGKKFRLATDSLLITVDDVDEALWQRDYITIGGSRNAGLVLKRSVLFLDKKRAPVELKSTRLCITWGGRRQLMWRQESRPEKLVPIRIKCD